MKSSERHFGPQGTENRPERHLLKNYQSKDKMLIIINKKGDRSVQLYLFIIIFICGLVAVKQINEAFDLLNFERGRAICRGEGWIIAILLLLLPLNNSGQIESARPAEFPVSN